jgi:hypothetical protein
MVNLADLIVFRDRVRRLLAQLDADQAWRRDRHPRWHGRMGYLVVRIDPDKVTPLRSRAQSMDYLVRPAPAGQ